MVMPVSIMLHGGGNLRTEALFYCLIISWYCLERVMSIVHLSCDGYEQNQKSLFWKDFLIPLYFSVRVLIGMYRRSFPAPKEEPKKTSYKDYIK